MTTDSTPTTDSPEMETSSPETETDFPAETLSEAETPRPIREVRTSATLVADLETAEIPAEIAEILAEIAEILAEAPEDFPAEIPAETATVTITATTTITEVAPSLLTELRGNNELNQFETSLNQFLFNNVRLFSKTITHFLFCCAIRVVEKSGGSL